jgi:hypothetical protein
VGQSWQNEPNNRSTNQVNCQQVARFAPNTDRFGVPKPKLGEDCLNEVQFLSRGCIVTHNVMGNFFDRFSVTSFQFWIELD